MSDINQRLMENANGGRKLNPDQLNQYMGVYRERHLLTASITDASDQKVLQHFPEILKTLIDNYPFFKVKISNKLPSTTQMTYLKTAKSAGIPASIIDQKTSSSDLGLLIFSDRALDIDDTDIKVQFPHFFQQETAEVSVPQKGFWARFFKK